MPVDGCPFPKKLTGAEISDEQLVFLLMDLVGVKAKNPFDFHFLYATKTNISPKKAQTLFVRGHSFVFKGAYHLGFS